MQVTRMSILAGLAQFGRDDRDDEDRKRPPCPAEGIGRVADRHQRKEDERRAVEGAADGDSHRAAGDALGIAADFGENGEVQLRADGREDGPDQQRSEQPLGHRTEGVDAVAMGGEDDVFAF